MHLSFHNSRHCPLIWIFYSRKLNHRINKIHECALRIVYNDHQCIFEELLERDNSFTIHERNLQKLATEMLKVNNGLSVQVVSEYFILQRIIVILDIDQEQNLRLVMLILKHVGSSLYHISDLRSGILWQHSKLRSNTGNLSIYAGYGESLYSV